MKKSVIIIFDEDIQAHITKGHVKISDDDGVGFELDLQEIRDIYEALISFENENNQRMV